MTRQFKSRRVGRRESWLNAADRLTKLRLFPQIAPKRPAVVFIPYHNGVRRDR